MRRAVVLALTSCPGGFVGNVDEVVMPQVVADIARGDGPRQRHEVVFMKLHACEGCEYT